jgi:asparagine synthetase B (glutamine-hydrolysing)
MFAFVVFDTRENTLTWVRDAFWIKLFYARNETQFIFASEPVSTNTVVRHRIICHIFQTSVQSQFSALSLT